MKVLLLPGCIGDRNFFFFFENGQQASISSHNISSSSSVGSRVRRNCWVGPSVRLHQMATTTKYDDAFSSSSSSRSQSLSFLV